MRIERLSPATNVVRFPIERRARPTLELMRQLAPSADDLAVLATGHDPEGLHTKARQQADSAAAKQILECGSHGAPVPFDVLDGLLAPAIAEAVSLCWSMQDATTAMLDAQQELSKARRTGDGWLDQLRARAAALTVRRAELLTTAHARVETAEGIARAVAFARRGEPWTPHAIDPTPELAAAPRELGYKATVRARVIPARPRRQAAATKSSRIGSDKGRKLPGAA